MIYKWGTSRRFNAYSNHSKKIFGSRIQKVSINAGFTCPNRDGSIGRGGCTYCNNNAFSPSYCTTDKSVIQQIEHGVNFHKTRYKGSPSYLAYFQSYSNTYDSLDKLKTLYSQALNHPNVIGLVIGTRPDCVDDAKLDYFQSLAENLYVSIEYGIESCYDKTLKRINRGHDFETAVKAIEKTANRNLNIGSHLIFGLPGESHQEMMEEANILSKLPLNYIKFHQLQIVKDTIMAKEFQDTPENFKLFGMDEYLEFFANFIEKLNPDFVVERFVGEAPPAFILNKQWGLRNDQIINKFEKILEERDSWQGKYYKE